MPEITTKPFSYRDDPDVPVFGDDQPLFVFDGICVLCSRGSGLLMRYVKAADFNFASMQSSLGQALYKHYGFAPDDSYLFIAGGRAFTKTRGYFEIIKMLGWPLAIFRIFKILPERWLDWLYDIVARKRYAWFGKTQYCALLTSEQRARLVSQ